MRKKGIAGLLSEFVKTYDYGIHTFELSVIRLTYSQVQKAIDYLEDVGHIQEEGKNRIDAWKDSRYFTSDHFIDSGIRLRIYQSYTKSNSIMLIINPSTLLSRKYQPVKLWKPKEESLETILEQVGEVFEELGLKCDIKKLSLSQMDLTINLWLKDGQTTKPLIHTLRKGMLPKHYTRVRLSKDLSPYEFIANKKGIVFKAYDKIHELKDNDRCPAKLKKKNLLRLELSLKRAVFLKELGLSKEDDMLDMLRIGHDETEREISGFVDKLLPCAGRVLDYREAKDIIRRNYRFSREWDWSTYGCMLYLLEKTSDSAGLDAAVQKLQKQFHLTKRKTQKILDAYDTLGINPITTGGS